MTKRIYVGNLNFRATESEIRDLFEEYGEVESVNLISDKESGRPRGFGFVEMADDDEADEAIEALDGLEHQGRNLKVNEARPRESRGGGGGGGRGSRGPRRDNKSW